MKHRSVFATVLMLITGSMMSSCGTSSVKCSPTRWVCQMKWFDALGDTSHMEGPAPVIVYDAVSSDAACTAAKAKVEAFGGEAPLCVSCSATTIPLDFHHDGGIILFGLDGGPPIQDAGSTGGGATSEPPLPACSDTSAQGPNAPDGGPLPSPCAQFVPNGSVAPCVQNFALMCCGIYLKANAAGGVEAATALAEVECFLDTLSSPPCPMTSGTPLAASVGACLVEAGCPVPQGQ